MLQSMANPVMPNCIIVVTDDVSVVGNIMPRSLTTMAWRSRKNLTPATVGAATWTGEE